MTLNRKSIIIFAILIVLGGGFLISRGSDETSSTTGGVEKRINQAPAFSLKDYNGNLVSSDDFGEKILIVNSWASWCPFCVNELPAFAELQKAFPDEIAVIAINREESKSIAKGYTDRAELSQSLVFLLDQNDSFYKSIGGFSMPETIFVNSKGDLLKHKRGPMEFDEMKKIIEDILAQN